MNKDLHDIDELFRSALEGNEEIPSAGVKENLDAALDKQDAEKYKKRFIYWKRATFLLLLLLAGFVLYESGIIKTSGNRYTEKKPELVKNDRVDNKAETLDPVNNTSGDSNTKAVAADEPAIQKENPGSQQDQKEIIPMTGAFVAGEKNSITKKITWPNNNQKGKQFDPVTTDKAPIISIISSQPGKIFNDATGYAIDGLISKRAITPLDERSSVSSITNRSIRSIHSLSGVAISNSPLKPNNISEAKIKKARSFKPFWMAAAFASYDQAGYKLDSDERNAVNSIKFREAHEPSFSLGILFTRQLKQKWGLQSGINYSKSAIGMKPQKTYAFVDPTGDVAYKYITSSGYAFFKPGFGPQPTVGDSLTTAEAKHRVEHISVPLVIKHTLTNKKISITPGAGIEANFITKANLEVDIEDPFNREIVVIRKLTGTKPLYWSFIADAEIKYNLNKKMSVSVRPVYRHAISSSTKNNVVETFPRSFGIGAGVTFKF